MKKWFKIFNSLLTIVGLISFGRCINMYSNIIFPVTFLSSAIIIGLFLGAFLIPGILWIVYYVVSVKKNKKDLPLNSLADVKTAKLKEVYKNENDLTYDLENRESDTNELKESEKQKEVILDLINSGVYSQDEGNIKIKQLEARELEIKELKEKKMNYDKVLKNLVYLLSTKLINDDEFNQKLKQIKQDYLNENTDTNIINKVPQDENNFNEIKKPDEIENKPKILFGMNYVDFIALLCLTFLMIVLMFFGN
jgi:hypothetical protein